MPVFKEEVRSRSKNPEKRKEKYESNSLFDSKAKLDKTVKDLAKTDNKVWFCVLGFCSQDLTSDFFLQLAKVVRFKTSAGSSSSSGSGFKGNGKKKGQAALWKEL